MKEQPSTERDEVHWSPDRYANRPAVTSARRRPRSAGIEAAWTSTSCPVWDSPKPEVAREHSRHRGWPAAASCTEFPAPKQRSTAPSGERLNKQRCVSAWAMLARFLL